MHKHSATTTYIDATDKPKIGFQRLKPIEIRRRCNVKPDKPYNKLTEHFRELVYKNKPYLYFITLTFGRNTSFNKRCQFTNYYLHIHNQMIFGRGYKNNDTFIRGFAFIEDHKSLKLEDRIHIHMLFKGDKQFVRKDFETNEGIFRKAAKKVRDGKNRQVFSDECINIKLVEDDGAIDYCFKEIWDNNICRVKILGKDGLSDNLV